MAQDMIDIAIVGTGPAGISAALTAKARGRKYMLFGSTEISPMLLKAHQINNYPGITGSGADLVAAFRAQLTAQQITITEKRITNIYPMGDHFGILAGQEQFDARTVILASGTDFGKPITGEPELLGKGVSYCATCDGMLYKGKPVAVISYAPAEEHDADFLANICSTVYYLPQYKGDVHVDSRCDVITEKPDAIIGEKSVECLTTKEGRKLDVACVFILRDSIAPTALIPGIVTENGKVVVDRNMQTNIPGCFAAGDITGAPLQIAKAVGEGNVAALSADRFVKQ